MSIVIPDALPVLAVGSHEAGSGFACLMNAIAYMKGDKQISDMPGCVWAPFARIAQHVNDTICLNQAPADCKHGRTHQDGDDEVREICVCVMILCGPCSHKVWLFGVPLIGTAELARSLNERQLHQAVVAMAAVLMDWEWEFRAIASARKTRPGLAEHWTELAVWASAAVRQVADGLPLHSPSPWANPPRRFGFDRAALRREGGGALVELHTLLVGRGNHAISALLTIANLREARKEVDTDACSDMSPSMDLMPQLVGILRRAAGQAEQADIVITEEDVARVPVAVA